MPADDYTAAVSGGLKLKNVSSSSKVSKSHKKQRAKPSQLETTDANAEEPKDEAKDDSGDIKNGQNDALMDKNQQASEDVEALMSPRAGKTEAELRHEERRRKRVRHFVHVFPTQIIYTRSLAETEYISLTSV